MQDTGRKVIIVEDDPGMRGSLEFLLEAHGIAVEAFDAADELADGLGSLAPACAILDVHLNGANGLAVYEQFRTHGRALPAIFITGRADDLIRAQARRLKAVALLEKPFSDSALLGAVERALAASATPAAA